MYNILISGYYGFDNIGDESILRTVVSSIRARIPDCRLTVLSHNPAATREKYGVEAVDRMSPAAIFRAVRACDMLVSGGGSLLQDVTSSKSIHYYLAIIRLAKRMGKRVFIYSQGIGPINRAANRRAAARALRQADGIVVRDERSADLLAEIGIPRDRVVITADPVIRMARPGLEAGARALRKAGASGDGRLTVGWAIREKDTDSAFLREVAACIRWLREERGAESVLIPFHYEEDREVSRLIAERTGAVCLNEKYLSEDMLSIIGNMDVMVGMRLHSLIGAAIMGVPMIGISYDPKCTAFLRSVGTEELCTKETFTARAFEAAFDRVGEDGQAERVPARMEALRRKLDTNEEMIVDILRDRKPAEHGAGQARAAGAIGLVFLLTLAAKLLGVVREMLQANYFGTGIDADLYTAAYNSTLYLYTTVCYALCIAAVPILTKEFTAGRQRGVRAADNLVTLTLLVSLLAVGLWQVFASTPLVGWIWDVDPAELPRLARYIRIMACSLPVVAAAYLMVALFQATDHYSLQGSMSIPYNVFLAVFLFAFGARTGIGGVVVASSAAWLLQLAMSIPYAGKEHYVYHPVLDWRAGYVGSYFKTAAVTVLTTSVFLFCYLIDTAAAASFSDSAVSAFYYADKLFTPLTTTVLYSISAVMFPRFNRAYKKEGDPEYLRYIWLVTENTLLFIFPVCAMMCVFGTDIIRVIFESGSFDRASTEATGRIFMMYAFGMSAFSVLDMLNKAFYAMKKTLAPLLINAGILALNLLLNGFFRTGPGVALATSLAITIGALAMLWRLFRGVRVIRLGPMLKGLGATLVMAAFLVGVRALLVNGGESKLMLVVKCGLTGAAGCVVYLGISLLLRQEIMTDLLRRVRASE